MPSLSFFGKGAVGFEQQFNGVAEVIPRFFQGIALCNGARQFFDVSDVAAPFLLRNLFVNGSKP